MGNYLVMEAFIVAALIWVVIPLLFTCFIGAGRTIFDIEKRVEDQRKVKK